MGSAASAPGDPPVTVRHEFSFGVLFMARVRGARGAFGLSQQDLSNRLGALGVRMSRDTIAQLETTPDRAHNLRGHDMLMICMALGVEPANLLTPIDAAERVDVTSRLTRPAGSVRGWLRGQWPLLRDEPDARERYFVQEASEDELDARAGLAANTGGLEAGQPAASFAALADQRRFGAPPGGLSR